MEDNLDLKINLLSGSPIEVEGVGKIFPPTLSQIKEVGFNHYQRQLSIITSTSRNMEIFKGTDFAREEEKSIFELALALNEEALWSLLQESFKFFLNVNEFYFDEADLVLYFTRQGDSEERYITRKTFPEIRKVIELQSCLKTMENIEEEDLSGMDEKTREIFEAIRQGKEEVERIKKNRGDSLASKIDIADVISAVSAKSFHYNKWNIWQLTIYQLYDEFNGLKKIENFHIGIKSMLAGATKVKLKHWVERDE